MYTALIVLVVLPYILAVTPIVGAIILGALKRWRSAVASLFLSILCFGWFYIEDRIGHWQMDELCERRSGQFIYERMYNVSSIHEKSRYCLYCYTGLVELGYSAVEFTRQPGEQFHWGRFEPEIGKSYRATLQSEGHPNCQAYFARYPQLAKRHPGRCIAVEPIANASAPVSITETRHRTRRVLGEIEVSHTKYVRESDTRLLTERLSFEWWSKGPLASYWRGMNVSGSRLSYGEFSCYGEHRRSEEIDRFISPAPKP